MAGLGDSLDTLQLKKIVEGALLAAGRPLSVDNLMNLFGLEDRQPTRDEMRAALAEIESDCAERGFELKRVASGYRFQVRQELSPWISRLWDERPQKYSRALLETLAIIAYRQPITRGEIEEIRGVSVSSYTTKTLLEREWVRVVGHRDVPGRPALFATTKQFLDYFNLKRLDELPTLSDIRDLAEFEPQLDLAGPEVDDSTDAANTDIEVNAVGENNIREDEVPEYDAAVNQETELNDQKESEVGST